MLKLKVNALVTYADIVTVEPAVDVHTDELDAVTMLQPVSAQLAASDIAM